MTVEEFNNEFDIQYNGVATNAAPPIDLYEKSVFLTKAQLELIKNYFEPRGNKYQKGFESSSKRRYDLKELVVPYSSTLKIESNNKICDDSEFFRIPDDTFLIVYEKAKYSASQCGYSEGKVFPKTHDEFNTQYESPFKRPIKNIVWRLDISSSLSSQKNVEIVSPYSIEEYKMRYVKYPKPIILTDLDVEFAGEGLSIDGEVASQTCMLSEGMHREILDRAVFLAKAAYKPAEAQIAQQSSLNNE